MLDSGLTKRKVDLMSKGNAPTDKNEICRALEDDFASTFITELIPGILHNFANPLNGIMGRAKLLQRRIEDNEKKMLEKYPEAAVGLMEEQKRIKSDIRAVTQESEYFFDMFKDVAGKFYALASKNDDKINISHLLAAEMRFFNYYLDFKHEIKKNMQWDKEIPDFHGNTADLSLAFWRIIRFALTRALSSDLKEFYIKTEHDNRYLNIFIKCSGAAIPAGDLAALMEGLNSDSMNAPGAVDQGVLLSFLLFNKYQAKINIFSDEIFNTISIGLPYRSERSSRKDI